MWGEALCQRGKELGEEVSRLCRLGDDEKESNRSFSVPSSLGNGDTMAKAHDFGHQGNDSFSTCRAVPTEMGRVPW